jgi:hypothetical protein
MVRTLAPPHLPDKPRHQVGAQKVGPKHLGVFIEPHQRPCVLPPRGHQVSGTPHLLEPLKDLESFLPALRHIPPPQILGQQGSVWGKHLQNASAHHVHYTPLLLG